MWRENKKKGFSVAIAVFLLVVVGVAICFKSRIIHIENKEEKNEKKEQIEVFVSKEELELYVQNNLIPEKGMVNLNPASITVTTTFGEEAEECARLQGILGYKILDLDADEQLELLVLYTEDYRNMAAVYEKENGYIKLKSEQMISDMWKNREYTDYGVYYAANYATNYWLLQGKEQIFLTYAHNWSGVYANGYDAEISLWKYNGEEILPVMNIDQQGLGSVFFSYISYKYDAQGMEISREVIYREEDMDGPAIFDADGSILASQFAEYDIEINTSVKLRDSIGALENLFADSVDKEQLCSLKMWIENDFETKNSTLLFNNEEAINHMNME